MDEITSLLFWQDDGLYIESGFKDLVVKIEKTAEEFEGEMQYSVSMDVYEASEVPLNIYRRWKNEENTEVVEVDAEKVNKNLLELTGKKEGIENFVKQQEEG